jgi:predicted glycosyltransferase
VTGAIGYYVHHHGDGHRQRALTIARHLPGQMTLIGTGLAGKTGEIPFIDLPDDRPAGASAFDGVDGASDRPLALHYAPVHNQNIRRRAELLVSWIARARPALLVVDVSVEIAMLARLCATPTAYVRLSGIRNDMPHLEAFRGARTLLSPFHPELDDQLTDPWVKEKTRYFPGLTGATVDRFPQENVILVVSGKGGATITPELLIDAALTTPSLRWRAIGTMDSPSVELPGNLEILGWVDAPEAHIADAAIVVGSAGDGVVNSVIAAGRSFICIPETRPFDEQISKAARLAALGAAIVRNRWPSASEWPDILAEARALPAANITRLHDPAGARCAAEYLASLANVTSSPS